MAGIATATAGGLMPHQKDEHDIWICKDCGWKYPNAKPSAKIRKGHKKHCPGKSGAHAGGGSSDDASDSEQHHAEKETLPTIPVETKTRSFDLTPEVPVAESSPRSTDLTSEGPVVESTPRSFDFSPAAIKAEEDASISGSPEPAIAEKDAVKAVPESKEVATAASGLMPHQKDEHDIWICKECGWKYPNARPSPKIRKNHKKHCPGKGGSASAAAAGSSDDASDDEHHVLPPDPQPTALLSGSGVAENGAPTETLSNLSREIDFAAAKQEPPSSETKEETKEESFTVEPANENQEVVAETPTAESKEESFLVEAATEDPEVSSEAKEPEVIKEESLVEKEGSLPLEPALETPAILSKEIDFVALKAETEENIPVEAASPGKETFEEKKLGDAPGGVISLKEVMQETEKENEQLVKPVSLQEAIQKDQEQEKEAAKIAFQSGLMLHQKDEADIWICKDCGWKYPNAKPSPKIRKNHKKKCPGITGLSAVKTGGSSDESTDDEQHSTTGTAAIKDRELSTPSVVVAEESSAPSTEAGNKSREFSFTSAGDTSKPAMESESSAAAPEKKMDESVEVPADMVEGLMPHQKDENDIWVCKECGWKYPNAKPSAKIRKNHKKKCTGKVGATKAKDGGSSDGSSTEDEKSNKGAKCFPCL